MEIPEISIISDFQAGVNCLQNPSIITRFFTLLGMEILPQLSSLWKWSAVILAIFAAFKRLKVLFIRFRGKVTPSLEQFVEHLVDDFEFSDDEDDNDDNCASISSNEDFSEEEDEDEDFRVAGGDFYINERGQNSNFLRLRRKIDGRRLSWTDFSTGTSVVKLWDGFEESCKNIVSIWDSTTFFDWGTEYQVSSSTDMAARKQTLTLTAEVNGNQNGVVLGGFDRRMTEGKTAFIADWAQKGRGVEKVYVRDGIEGVLTVGDVRNLKTPLKAVRLRGSNGGSFGGGD